MRSIRRGDSGPAVAEIRSILVGLELLESAGDVFDDALVWRVTLAASSCARTYARDTADVPHANLAFDAAVMDLFGALLNGACLAPIDLRTEDPATIRAGARSLVLDASLLSFMDATAVTRLAAVNQIV